MNNSEKGQAQMDRIMRYANLIQKQAGKAVRPYRFDENAYREDGYVNVLNRYGTSKDTSEHYKFEPEPTVPDDVLTMLYEGNGLFAKIIDTPAEEAMKHGFTLEGIEDQKIETFYREAYEELDGDEAFMTGIKWARLFGGAIAVMMINDGRGIDEPLDWSNIQSIDDIRIYDRSLIQPDYSSMFSYDPRDPFRTRGSRLGMPEYYSVFSKYGSFTVHDSRCLVFQNGILPENTTNSVYQLWGMPEYIRLKRAIRDSELAHSTAPKMLDRSVQAIYKMKDLAATLATEQGEDAVLKRLQVIDMARGLLNSITIDAENEDYDFKQFQFTGVSEIIDQTSAHLSSLTNIPQALLFGTGVGGMSSTDDTSMEAWYNFCERIQRRMVKSNLRYLMSIIFQAGVATGEIEEVPPIKVKFNPLWSLSETEQVDLEQKKAQVQSTKAQTANTYVTMGAIDPTEVRKKLAESEEFDVENMLDDIEEEDLMKVFEEQMAQQQVEGETSANGGTVETGNSPDAAPAATKLPQDMNGEDVVQKEEEGEQNQDDADDSDKIGSVAVLVVRDGKILCGTRHNDFGYGLVCGPGGHVEKGETLEQAALRETEEEFGIVPKRIVPLGLGPTEPDTGLTPMIYLCKEFEGEPDCADLEIANPQFCTLEELEQARSGLFQPFADSIDLLKSVLFRADSVEEEETEMDGGEGSGNFGHEGRPGAQGGSTPSGKGKKYSNPDEYKAAKSKAAEARDRWMSDIDSEYEKERSEIDSKYGNRMRRRIEIRRSEMTDEEKAIALQQVDEDFEKRSAELLELSESTDSKRKKADEEYSSVFEPDYEYDKIQKEHSMEDDVDAKTINPSQKTQNCQRCAVAFEMRRRGYDVEASEGEGDYLGNRIEIARCFIGAETETFSSESSDELTSSVREKMLSFGDGSRAIICAQYGTSYAHAYNVCVESGEVFVCDSQIGAKWSDKTSLESGGRVNLGLDGAVNAMVIRTDTSDCGIGVENYVKGRSSR